MNKKLLLALSGGVDSSASAELLIKRGYFVSGVVMLMSDGQEKTAALAREASRQLGIRLYELDLRKEFKSTIIDYFISEYLAGRTPSPCVKCNPEIKFKQLLSLAESEGFDYIATGHYARVQRIGRAYRLAVARDLSKDQSYMLAGLDGSVLSRLVLPLGELTKSEVRELAKSTGLSSWDAPDSQENCFIPSGDYREYISQHAKVSPPGDIISPEGSVCGRHSGIYSYTIGQRKGLGVALGRPAFVSKIDPENALVYLSYDKKTTDRVRLQSFRESYPGAVSQGMSCLCRLRSTGKLLKAKLSLLEEGGAELLLDSPTPSVSSGQAGVVYSVDDIPAVLGMGTVEDIQS